MSAVGNGIRAAFVIRAGDRFPSSPSSSSPAAAANVWIVKGGARYCTAGGGGQGRIAVEVKCAAHQDVGIPIAERKLISVPVVTEGDIELALPPSRNGGVGIVAERKLISVPVVTEGDVELLLPPTRNGEGAGIPAPPHFESAAAAHQLEIALHDLTFLSTQLSEEIGGDDDIVDETGSSPRSGDEQISPGDESAGDASMPPRRRKKIWQGVRRRRRMPPQPPWSTDDFARKAKLMLDSILSESSKGDQSLVEDVLNSWLGEITRVELTRLMKDLCLRRRPSLALEVFFWMQRQKGRLKPSPHIYSAIIGILGRAGMLSEARGIFDSQQVRSLQSVHIYNSMMGAYLKCGNFKTAWALYEDLCDRQIKADEVTFNTLLSGVSQADMPLKTAETIFSKMKLTGIPPGQYTFNTLIMVFSKCGHVEGAAARFEEMRNAKQTPDLYTYNTVIGMYGRAGKYDEALQVYEDLKGAGLYPDVVTYTHLMKMFSQANNVEAAIDQFSEMQRVGCMPDFITYSLVVHMYGRVGRAAEAELTFKRMQEAGFKPNVVTWSSLIQAYGKKGMLEKIRSSFAEMLKSGCKPDASLFNIMMSAYRQAELPIHAACLFRRMQSQGIKPNAACFNTLIHAFFKSGQREDATAWHAQMVRCGFAPDKLSRRLLNNLSPRGGRSRDPRRVQRLHSIQPL